MHQLSLHITEDKHIKKVHKRGSPKFTIWESSLFYCIDYNIYFYIALSLLPNSNLLQPEQIVPCLGADLAVRLAV